MAKSDIEDELNKLLGEFRDWDEARRKAAEAGNLVRAPLYHYCDMSSLVGIVQHKELWLTSIFHMNDPSELRHGRDLAIKHLRSIPGEGAWKITPNDPTAQGQTTIVETELPQDRFCFDMIERLGSDYGSVFGFFVGSFSQAPDDLAQWRSYADDGRGVAIEVSSEWFHPVEADVKSAPIQDLYSVSNVIYDEQLAEQRQKEAIDLCVDIIRRAEAKNLLTDEAFASKFMRDLRVALAVPLLWNCLTTKHPAYGHEKETRLILINDKSKLANVIKTRTRGSQIVSYIPISFPISKPDVLRRVWIGPAAVGEAESGVETLLRANGIDPTSCIKTSKIPYRPR